MRGANQCRTVWRGVPKRNPQRKARRDQRPGHLRLASVAPTPIELSKRTRSTQMSPNLPKRLHAGCSKKQKQEPATAAVKADDFRLRHRAIIKTVFLREG